MFGTTFGSGTTPMIDKMIGTAFKTVKLVADNLENLTKIADNLDKVGAVATAISGTHNTTLEAVLGGNPYTTAEKNKLEGVYSQTVLTLALGMSAGATTTASIGAVAPASVKDIAVRVTGLDGNRYFPGSGMFTYFLGSGGVSVKLSDTAASSIFGATATITLYH